MSLILAIVQANVAHRSATNKDTPYPKGALRSVEELKSNTVMWAVTAPFEYPAYITQVMTGDDVIPETHPMDPNGLPVWVRLNGDWTSVRDRNLHPDHRSNHNYLFHRYDDAINYKESVVPEKMPESLRLAQAFLLSGFFV